MSVLILFKLQMDELLQKYGFKKHDTDWILEKSNVKIVYRFDFSFLSKCILDNKYYPVYLQRNIETLNEAINLFHILTGDFIQPIRRKVIIC